MLKARHVAYIIGGGAVVAAGVFAVVRARRAISHIGPVTGTVTINKPPREVYELFRDFSRLPEFMSYLDKVEEDGETSTWTAIVPVIGKVTWKAKIIDDVPGKLLSWQSEPESRVNVRGRVTFTKAPGRESTEVRAEMQLAGSSALARFFAAPEVKGDLRRFKQVVETGEVLRSDASAHKKPHPAQPSPDAQPAPDFFIPHNANVSKGAVS
jgi:uncharacterized membrane protein